MSALRAKRPNRPLREDEGRYFTVFVSGEIFGLPSKIRHTSWIASVTSVALSPGIRCLGQLRGKI